MDSGSKVTHVGKSMLGALFFRFAALKLLLVERSSGESPNYQPCATHISTKSQGNK